MASAETWAKRVSAWRASGETADEFAAGRGFAGGTLPGPLLNEDELLSSSRRRRPEGYDSSGSSSNQRFQPDELEPPMFIRLTANSASHNSAEWLSCEATATTSSQQSVDMWRTKGPRMNKSIRSGGLVADPGIAFVVEV
jgi:hypothetical protein